MGYELTHKFGRFSTGPNQPILGHTKLEPYPNLALKPFLEGITKLSETSNLSYQINQLKPVSHLLVTAPTPWSRSCRKSVAWCSHRRKGSTQAGCS
jgi:hypothetical protein